MHFNPNLVNNMLTIQQVGTEILMHKPQKFYVFLGDEYGIKSRYLDELAKVYNNVKNSDSVQDILSLSHKRSLIALSPTLYIVRYDLEFAKSLSDTTATLIKTSNINGTLVLIYEDTKLNAKFDKYLGTYSVVIDHVHPAYIVKYLKTEFPELPDIGIDIAAKAKDYAQARNIAKLLSNLSTDSYIFNRESSELTHLLNLTSQVTDDQIKTAIASRNFAYLHSLIQHTENYENIIYLILNTITELDKVKSSKYSNSGLKDYAKLWTFADLYNMYCQSYAQLLNLRTKSSNTYDCLIYLMSLLNFQSIPPVGAL